MKNKHRWKYPSNIAFDDDFALREIETKKRSRKSTSPGVSHSHRVMVDTQDFKCRQCGAFVSARREFSGVNNRNHCPDCLWSRHVDLMVPGDRKADCGSRMQPIGLTVKRTPKRYARSDPGELMLVHCCTGCGKLSINRIAADDDAQLLFQLYLRSGEAEAKQCQAGDIHLLNEGDFPLVYTRLFGTSTFIQGMDWQSERLMLIM